MTNTPSVATSSEAVGVFEDAKALQSAIDELLSSGFDRAELSVLASEQTVMEKLGHAYKRVEELEDDAAVPRAAYVSTESVGDAEGALVGAFMYVGATAAAGAVVATGAVLATAIAAAALAGGIGGLMGSVLAGMVGDEHARHIQEPLDHGGLLLWVRTRDADHEERAKEILSQHSAHDVHIHQLPTHP